MKICTTCNIEKSLDCFGKSKLGKFGVKSKCKKCINESQKTPEEREKNRLRREKNKDHINKKQNERYHRTKQLKGRKKSTLTEEEKKDRVKLYNKKRYEKNPEKYRERSRKNRQIFGNYGDTKKKWYNEKMKNDPLFKAWENLSCNFRNRFNKNGIGLEKLVGYSKEDLITKLGHPKINDDLDHKIPVTWFKVFEPELVYSLDNLQWLNKQDNNKKSNRYFHPISLSFFDKIKSLLKDEYLTRFKQIGNEMIDSSINY